MALPALLLAAVVPFVLGCQNKELSFSGSASSHYISGRVVPLDGSVSDRSLSAKLLSPWKTVKDLISQSVSSASCDITDVKVKLYYIDSSGVRSADPVAQGNVRAVDGQYTVPISPAVTSNLSTASGISYVMDVVGCTPDMVYSRLLTGVGSQNVTLASSLTVLALDSSSAHRARIPQVHPQGLQDFIGEVDQGAGTVSSLVELYDYIDASPTLKIKFFNLFGFNLSELITVAPRVLEINVARIQPEGESTPLTVNASHWNPNYPIFYEWRLDGVPFSNDAETSYTPVANDPGSHTLTLAIGRNDGAGAVDLTIPHVLKSFSIVVPNTILPHAPSFSVVEAISGLVATRNITLELNTGAGFANCASFSKMAITENSATAPTNPASYSLTCTSAGTQTTSYSLSSSGYGAKILYLWAMDARGAISPVPSLMSLTLLSAPSSTYSTFSVDTTAAPADGATHVFLTVRLKDDLQNPIPGRTISVSSNRAGLDSISAVNSVTNSSGVAIFKVNSSTTGTSLFTATDTTDSFTLVQSPSVSFGAGGISGALSSLAADAPSVTADGVSPVTMVVTLKDVANQPMVGNQVAIRSSRSGDLISPASIVTDANGQATFTVASTAVGSAVFTAYDVASGISVNQTQSVNFLAGRISIASSQLSLSRSTLDPGETAILTLKIYDDYGHLIESSQEGANFNAVLTSGGTSRGNFSGFSPVSGSLGVYTSTFTASTGGTATPVRVYLSGQGALAASPNLTVRARLFRFAGPSTVATGVCSSAFTLSHRDETGSVLNLTANKTIVLSGTGSGAIYSDPACTNVITSLTMAAGSNSKTFYFKDVVKESLILSASASGISAAQTPLQVTGTPAQSLRLSGPSPVTVDTCSTSVAVEAIDAYKNLTAVDSAKTINLVSDSRVKFFSDSACTQNITSLTLAAGKGRTEFYYKAEQVGTFLLTGKISGLNPGNFTAVIQGGAPTHIGVEGPATLAAGECGTYVITALDAKNNPTTVAAALAFTIARNGSGATFSSATCTTSFTNATIVAGASNRAITYKNNTAQTQILTITGAGLVPTTFSITTTPTAVLTKLGILGENTLLTNTCGAYKIVARDANNNDTNVSSNVSVNLTGNGAGSYYSDASCTSPISTTVIASGTNGTFVYFKAATVASFALNAADQSGTLTTAALGIATKAYQFIITGSTTPAPGTCNAYTITYADGSGTPTPAGSALAVALAGNGTGAYFSDAGCTTGISSTTIGIGASAATVYFKDANTEALTLTATQTSAVTGKLSISVGAMKLTLAGPAAPTIGACSAAYTVTALDAFGVATAVSANTTVSLLGSGGGLFYSDSSCSTVTSSVTLNSGSSSQSFYFKSQISENLLFTAMATGMTLGTLPVTPAALSPTSLAIAGNGQMAQGMCSAAYVVRPQDIVFNPVAAVTPLTVNLGASGSASFYSDSTCTTPITQAIVGIGATSAIFYVKDSTLENVTLTLTDAAGSLSPAVFNVVVVPSVSNVALGDHHSCMITGGAVLCWGNNLYGQLGNNSNVNNTAPVQVQGLSSGVVAIAGGGYHTCALTSAGAMKCWGRNNFGQLGNRSVTDSRVPVSVTGFTSGVTSMALGTDHTCAVKNGGAFCWGSGKSGQIGDGAQASRSSPTAVSGLSSGVTGIMTGGASSCALVGDAVKCWGINSNASLGNGTMIGSFIPTQVVGLETGSGTSALGVSTGTTLHHCAIVTNGGNSGAQCWGYNARGYIGDGTSVNRTAATQVTSLTSQVTKVVSGYYETCAIVNGGAKCWGYNTNGQLGNKTLGTSTVPVDVWGLSSGVTDIGAGNVHACAIANGVVNCWGSNSSGQLGLGSVILSSSPVQVQGMTSGVSQITVGKTHVCARLGDSVKCWGENTNGQLGDGTIVSSSLPVQTQGLALGSLSSDVAAGSAFTCAVVNGAPQCWGLGTLGRLGNSSAAQQNTPTAVADIASGASSLAIGRDHGCAIVNGAVKCWGTNTRSQLGDGTTIDQWTPKSVTGLAANAAAVTVGAAHSCVLVNGSVKCWGANSSGQLGDNSVIDRSTPITVSGLNSGVTKISAGLNHTCAVVNGALKCWGDNSNGQLGNNSLTAAAVPSQVLGMDSGVTAVSAGSNFTCAIKGGGVFCWGLNSSGQLGTSLTSRTLTPLSVEGLSSGMASVATSLEGNLVCALSSGGGVQCWGEGGFGQLGNGIASTPYSSVAMPVVPTGSVVTSLPSLGGSQLGSKIVLTGPTTATAGLCSSLITVTLLDPSGNPDVAVEDQEFQIYGIGSGSFYLDAQCQTPMDDTLIPADSNTLSFYYMNPLTEDVTLSAEAEGYTSTSLSITVAPAPTQQISLAGPTNLTVGTCSSAFTLRVLNGSGVLESIAQTTDVTMNGLRGGKWYSDAACANAFPFSSLGQVVTLTAGTQTKDIYYKNDRADYFSFGVSAVGFKNSALVVRMSAGSPSRLDITGPNVVSTGQCSSAFYISSQDQFRNSSVVTANTTVSLDVGGLGQFYSDSQCTVPTATTAIAAGSSGSAPVYFYGTIPNTSILIASATSMTSGLFNFQVKAGTASGITLSAASPIGVSTCAPVTISVRDSYGNGSTLTAPQSLTFDGKGSGVVYSNSTCSTVLTNPIAMSKGDSSLTVYFKDTVAENLVFAVSSPDLSSGTLAVSTVGGVPTKLALSGAATLLAGSCGAYKVSTLDASNYAANATSNVTVSLGGNGVGAFYSDSGCSTSVSTATVASGSNQATFYFKAASATSFVFTAADSSLNLAAATNLAVATRAAQLQIAGPSTLAPGSCGTFTLTNANSVGTPTNVSGNQTVALAGKGAGAYYSDAGCTTVITSSVIANGTSAKTVYFKDATPEFLTLTGTNATMVTGTFNLSVGAMKLAISGSASPSVGVCSSYNVSTTDGTGLASNALANVTVSLLGAGAGSFYSDAGCSTPASSLSIGAGGNSAGFYFKTLSTDPVTFVANATSYTSATMNITPQGLTPTRLNLSGSPSAVVNVCSGPYKVRATDTYGSVVNFPGNVTINLSGAGSGQFYSDSSCATAVTVLSASAADTSKEFYLRNAVVDEQLSLIATDGSAVLSAGSLNVAIIQATTQLSVGLYSSCAVKEGVLSCWGYNSDGQIGAGVYLATAKPQRVRGFNPDVTSVAVGLYHTCALTQGGAVYCLGRNSYGGLGDNSPFSTGTRNTPTMAIASGATSITSGAYHSCSVMSDKTVQCWGSNLFGQLGDSSTVSSGVPITVRGLADVVKVSAGYNHTCAITTAGALYCWGTNGSGQLGDGTIGQRTQAVMVTGMSSGVTDITTGYTHTCAIKSGSLWCWGSNTNGELGNGAAGNSLYQVVPAQVPNIGGVQKITASRNFTCAILSGGEIQCWGLNTNGQLGNNELVSSPLPVSVVPSGATDLATGGGGPYHMCATVNGAAQCWGYNLYGQVGSGSLLASEVPMDVVGLPAGSGVTSLVSNANSTCAIASGALKCWGANNQGQLGNGTTDNSSVPVEPQGLSSGVSMVSIGDSHTCAIVSGGLKCWGLNSTGQLGIGSVQPSTVPKDVFPAGSGVTSVSCGRQATCAVVNGGVQCWGANTYGTLGIGNKDLYTIPMLVPTLPPGSGVQSVNLAYSYSSCALMADGSTKCWGFGTRGQLGNGSFVHQTSPVDTRPFLAPAVQLGSSASNYCALLSNGGLQCWGYGSSGVNGIGTTASIAVPTTPIGMTSGVTTVAGSNVSMCAIQNSALFCWGSNNWSQLESFPNSVSTVPLAIPALGASSGVSDVAPGFYHICAIVNGGVKCWGANFYNQLGGGRDYPLNVTVPTYVSPF